MKAILSVVCICGMLLVADNAQAGNGDPWALSQWQRRIWQIEDGLPHNYVTAITQTLAGRLLIGTKSGIVTFDGFKFVPYPALGDIRIDSLLQSPDGTVWAGTHGQGLYRIRDGRATKIASETFFSLTQGNDGRIWCVSDAGMGFIENDRFRMAVPGTHAGASGWQSTSLESDGSILFAADNGLFRYRDNRVQSIQLRKVEGLPVGVYSTPNSHELLLGTTKGLYQLTCNKAACLGAAINGVQGPVVGVHQASDQTLWIATWGHGLYRLSRSGGDSRVENMDSSSGLPDVFVHSLYEDNEHNMWLGTRGGGLTRFRTTFLKPFGVPEGVDGNCASAAVGDGEGGVWLGTWRSGLFHWSNGKIEQQPLSKDRLDVLITALVLDADRNLWIGSFDGLRVLRHGQNHMETFPRSDAYKSVRQILFTRDKSLWIVSSNGQLSVYPSGDPATSQPQSVLSNEQVSNIAQDDTGAIWIGTATGLWRATGSRSEPVRVSRSSSPMLSLSEDWKHRLWTTYEDGSILVRTAAGITSFPQSGFPNKLIYKVMEDREGNFWFSTGLGLAWVSGYDAENALKTHATEINTASMGVSDGARTIECRCAEHPQSWIGPNGNMWIPTAKGFVQADPRRLRGLPSPQASIESVQWDGGPPLAGSVVDLPAGSHNLEIHFTAVRLGAADEASFRYRMEGVDDRWIDAGRHRTARYTQLAPGRYRFQVAARDVMGDWGGVADASIDQRPHLYQTFWFKCGIPALTLLLMTAIYVLRLRSIRNRYNAVLEERRHIAREWHDTLLSGLSAIAWQLDAAIHICNHPALLASLTNVRSMLRYCNNEARLAVDVLRPESLEPTDIAVTLREMLQRATLGTPVRFELNVDRSMPRVSGKISRDLLRIGQEATTNAIRHGNPTTVSVSLCRDESKAVLCVYDDGLGMDPALIEMPLPGHFGLLGMRERLQRIGGELEISTAPGQGTTVNARVPIVA